MNLVPHYESHKKVKLVFLRFFGQLLRWWMLWDPINFSPTPTHDDQIDKFRPAFEWPHAWELSMWNEHITSKHKERQIKYHDPLHRHRFIFMISSKAPSTFEFTKRNKKLHSLHFARSVRSWPSDSSEHQRRRYAWGNSRQLEIFMSVKDSNSSCSDVEVWRQKICNKRRKTRKFDARCCWCNYRWWFIGCKLHRRNAENQLGVTTNTCWRLCLLKDDIWLGLRILSSSHESSTLWRSIKNFYTLQPSDIWSHFDRFVSWHNIRSDENLWSANPTILFCNLQETLKLMRKFPMKITTISVFWIISM